MANTYTQFYIHFIFAVQNRKSIINQEWQTDLFRYINGIVEHQGHKPFTINGMPDHVHLLVSMRPDQPASELMFHVKRNTSLWINENKLTPGNFSWQEGYGAFSYGKSQIPNLVQYINNQQKHHLKRTFHEEYIDFLKAFEIEYNLQYIFKSIE